MLTTKIGDKTNAEKTMEICPMEEDEKEFDTRPEMEPFDQDAEEDIVDEHNLTHANYASWCPTCVAARGLEASGRRVPEEGQGGDRPLVQADYVVTSRDGHQTGTHKAMFTVFVICDDREPAIPASRIQRARVIDTW